VSSLLVGLTGGIASGKSTIAAMLAERGAVIVDADQLAREAVEPGSDGLDRIRRRFGADIASDEGVLDRERLGSLVFSDPTARNDLNAIVHPAVRALAETKFRLAREADPDAVIVYDVPLLTETGIADQFDLVVVADAPADLRVERLIELRGHSREDAERRVSSQASDAQRRQIADVIIDTSGSREDTETAVAELWDRLGAR